MNGRKKLEFNSLFCNNTRIHHDKNYDNYTTLDFTKKKLTNKKTDKCQKLLIFNIFLQAVVNKI